MTRLGWCRWLALWAALGIALIVPRGAFAEPRNGKASSAETAEYRRAVDSALSEFNAGNFPEARALFTRAHELYPNARTYRGLGFVAFELRNYADCVGYLEAALRSGEKPLSDKLRSSTEELLARAKGLIARVYLDVSPAPRAVSVDGLAVRYVAAEPLIIEVGDHLLEVQASGYVPERRALKIAGGEELRIAVQLRELPADEPTRAPLVAAPAPASAPRQDSAPRRPLYKNPWLWTAVAVVAIGAGVGLGVGLSSRSKHVEPDEPATGANTPMGGIITALTRRP